MPVPHCRTLEDMSTTTTLKTIMKVSILVYGNLRQSINLAAKKSSTSLHIVLLHSYLKNCGCNRSTSGAYRQSIIDFKEVKIARKKAKSEEAEEYERTEGILYGAGIAD
ncbi:hypothetical protein CDAR_586251 [Caerostris darwini]|uniref:Uncharacterized protein n=1 Tax=Caerostris darwini TaxID=1538125 RepID=A0AAV4VFQ1_9ARAC|nr:hypothetical protein CDAR_586251 [Caerostris darwini]